MKRIIKKFFVKLYSWMDDLLKSLREYIPLEFLATAGILLLPIPLAIMILLMKQIFLCFNIGELFNDLYEIYVDFFAPLSTILLSVIALWVSVRLQHLEEEIDARNRSCNIYIENFSSINLLQPNAELSNDADDAYKKSENYLSLTIQNLSDVFLKEIDIDFGKEHFHSNITLIKDKAKSFTLYLPKIDTENDLCCKVKYTSSNNGKTYADFKISMKGNSTRREIKHYHFYGTEQPK